MRPHRLAVALLAALALALAPAAWAQAAWQATLAPAQEGQTYTPTEALHLGLPASVDAQARTRLALEVDAIDVTALASISDGGIAYTPLQALTPGKHEVRLVEYDDNGNVREHGAWSVTVAAAATVTGGAEHRARSARSGTTQMHADVSLGGSERVADHNLSAPQPARFSSDGSASLGMTTKGERWSTATEVDLTQASPAATANAVNPGASGDQGGVQLAQFSVSAQSDTTHLMLGDQSLPYNGLAVSQLNRRGVAGEMQIKPLRASIGAFSMRSDVVTGFGYGLGVGDPDHRVSGIVFGLHPFKRADALDLTLAYVSGRGAPDGTATYSVPFQTAPAGTALGLDADSQLLDRRLHMHAAVAHSNYDFGVPSLPSRSDNARNFLVSYQPGSGSDTATPRVSSLTTLTYQSTGSYFRSLANTGVTPDLREWQLAQSLNGSIWSLQGTYALDTDNVDDDPLLASIHTRRLQLAAGLFPSGSPKPGSFAAWLGTPYYSLSFDASRSRNGTLPDPGYPRTDLDISNLNASAQFSHPRWNWNLGLMLGSATDHTGQQDDTRVFGPTFGANVTLGDTGSVGFALQYSDTHDRVTDGHSRDTSYNIFASGDLITGKLTGQLNYSITRTAQAVSQFMGVPQPGMSYNTRTFSGALLWHALAARTNHPGVDVSLNGVWNHGGYPTLYGNQGMPGDTWQIFLKVALILPLRYPGGMP